MKTKFFLAAAMVAFSFAMISCGGNKTANSEAATDSTSVAVEAVAACDQKTECPQNANCEKKACDKK